MSSKEGELEYNNNIRKRKKRGHDGDELYSFTSLCLNFKFFFPVFSK